MRLVFAAAEGYPEVLRAEGAEYVLTPYPAVVKNPSILDTLEGFRIFLDSGAWSVASGASPPIDPREHAAFVKQHAHRFWKVAAVDVLGDPEASWRNYIVARDYGLDDVLPTWHVGEPLTLASRYAAQAPSLAIGGLASRAKSGKVTEYIAKVWPLVKHRAVHLFGVGTVRPLVTFQPDSADMSGWIVGATFGEVYSLLRWPTIRNFDVTRNASDFDRAFVVERVAEFRAFGFSWKELAASPEARLRYNVRVLREFERRVNRAGERTREARA